MARKRQRLILLAVSILCSRAGAADMLNLLSNGDRPPFDMVSGSELAGLSTDILRTALARAGIAYRFGNYPSLRANEMALHGADNCTYSLIRTPEREDQFKWVGPLTHDAWVVFAKSDNPLRLKSIDDLKSYRIGVNRGEALQTLLENSGVKVDAVSFDQSDDTNLKRLLAGRIDFWATGLRRALFVAKSKGVAAALKQSLLLKNVDIYLACNKSVSDTLIARLNGEIDAMREDGTIDRLDIYH